MLVSLFKTRQIMRKVFACLILAAAFVIPHGVHADTSLQGVALKDPTNVYQKASTNAKVLKSYQKGSVLIYESHNSSWYKAKVKVNGKYVNGYIDKNDVDTATNSPKSLSGLALKNPTAVYASASSDSKKLKTYAVGKKLTYRTFTSQWYQATVYVNGKKKTGYIYQNDTETAAASESFEGIATANPAHVYKEASRDGGSWKNYQTGSILKYEAFSQNWYQATVYVNGKRKTGFIHHADVTNAVSNPQTLQGIALEKSTGVYSQATTGSKKLKSYAEGTILKFQTFAGSWYKATVYVSGKKKTGYIYANHVEELFEGKQKALNGRAVKKPTNVYQKPSRSGKTWKSYQSGTILKFEPFSKNWFKATVYVSGKAKTGYIHASDVTTEDITNITKYPYTFKHMVDMQMKNGGPKSDGAGKIKATREEVEYYANPSNFRKGTDAYYQFLDLSQSAGLNEKEVNEKVLKGEGILEGEAKAFIDAGKANNINEAYLIAHTIHETGHGTSTLAKGVPVDEKGNIVKDKKKANIVYNMYGYGAKDSCPVECGVKYAFDHKWFTPYESIVGEPNRSRQTIFPKAKIPCIK
ncbi:glucosaminidase domain-containing protein [Virgibacillus sp. 179-BFC.A HS]|uniref:Glucosaminidase domain-containing protein n=1 Tax=Tigheibacillus jepli TaxID=3035914 RepID=A0ABU5CE53_9BACI|nr:glucosaminidase domain-containing protein [Virgibacillus sp. 179-BFC.A HS]MDY0404616.1 glucosaminidase domain-containing protein [Virgibacillus sp. 179-BFC.A HS]